MNKLAELAEYEDIEDFVAQTGYRDMQIEASLHMFTTDTADGIPRDDAVENIFILEQIIDELGISSLRDYFKSVPKRYTTKEIRTVSADNDKKDRITADAVQLINKLFAGKEGFDITQFDGQIRVDFPDGFIMYGMSNTSPKLTFMTEGSSIEMRNNSLAFVLGLHNELKKKYDDKEPMDLSENDFFTTDSSFGITAPDSVNINDERFNAFITHCGISPKDIVI